MLNAVRRVLRQRQTGPADGHDVIIAIFDTWPISASAPASYAGGAVPRELARIDDRLKALPHVGGSTVGQPPYWRLTEAASGQLVSALNIHDCAPPRDPAIKPCTRVSPHLIEDVSDHGLFIADIIKDIAPKAELVVYRVFSDDGFGDLHRIADAISDAIKYASNYAGDHQRKLVLNMSFGFGPQLELVEKYLSNLNGIDGDVGKWLALQDAEQPPTSADAEVTRLINDNVVVLQGGRYTFTGPLEVLDTVFTGTGGQSTVLGVAAAGNDSAERKDKPFLPFGPRLPAASDGVIAVRAWQPPAPGAGGAWKPETYSNDDDLFSNNDGVGALGGSLDNFAAARDNAIYGLYVSDPVPTRYSANGGAPQPGAKNDSGWAYWSGTSFAAPIVAAFAACLWSEASNLTAGQIRNLIVNRTEPKEYLDFRQRRF